MRLYTNTMLDWVYNPVISGWYIPFIQNLRARVLVYNPVISGWYIPLSLETSLRYLVYNPVISGWYIPPFTCTQPSLLVYNPVISGWCIPSTGIQFPESAGRHLSHNKPANRVFLLPRRPCISTGVNSGYTVRTHFLLRATIAHIFSYFFPVFP